MFLIFDAFLLIVKDADNPAAKHVNHILENVKPATYQSGKIFREMGIFCLLCPNTWGFGQNQRN